MLMNCVKLRRYQGFTNSHIRLISVLVSIVLSILTILSPRLSKALHIYVATIVLILLWTFVIFDTRLPMLPF